MTGTSTPWEQRFIRLMIRAGGSNPELTAAALPPGYSALTPPALAVRDNIRLRSLTPSRPVSVDLWQGGGRPDNNTFRLQVYSLSRLSLDHLMPYLQNLRLRVADQLGFSLHVDDRRPAFIRSFFVALPESDTPLPKLKRLLLDALGALLDGAAENDTLNGMVILNGLPWQDVDVFRAYRNYYLQWNRRCPPERFQQALQRNPAVVELLHRYFEARFGPDPSRLTAESREEETLPAIRQELAAALDAATDTTADRILRDLFNLMDATLRTNHYLRRYEKDRFLALKLDSMGIFAMPSPKPNFEIYVHSPSMEGIHLRCGKVARGGIRWSDRLDDFRDEILDLMRTQMIKNALIVPQGAKGGFIVKSANVSRQEAQQQARAAYMTLIRGLLDLTDNRCAPDKARHPSVLAYDGEDPYLVVAADKGTSHFSDLANTVAAEYRFWLGDAFASGGSHGYDHKRLGITAKGAWECVRRHFTEMGRDPDAEPLTVIGVGSMDGDVFGNGMLLSRQIRLLGAFGSSHIFLDPAPDPNRSYEERRRLFQSDGCSWNDYDPALLSPGGGIFARGARNIPLSAEVRRWLGVRHRFVDGDELVRLLLTSAVDLLWLGGIGTYVKASSETHDDVGDRGNDSCRVDACQLQAKVVGEGANLGFTQLARIEYALKGGRINTDAVDNSGGVDLSDHEVNLKIFMAEMATAGTAKAGERDRWLAAVKDEVCASVLAHNREQSLCISLDAERCRADVEPFLDTADALAGSGLLDRRNSFFPSRKEIIAREGRMLTRPELAVLMPCSKLALKRALLEHDGFLSPWIHDGIYYDYFPAAVRQRFAEHLSDHSLAREIAATQIANWIVGRAGSSFPAWSTRLETEALLRAIEAYLTFDRAFGFEALRDKIRCASTILPIERRYRLLLELEDVIALAYRWARKRGLAIRCDQGFTEHWRNGLTAYLQYFAEVGKAAGAEAPHRGLARALQLSAHEERVLSCLRTLADFPVLMELSERTEAPMGQAAAVYFRLAADLGVADLLTQLQLPPQGDHWERRTRSVAAFRLRLNLMRLAARFLSPGGTRMESKTPAGRDFEFERFKSRCRELLLNRAVPTYGICALVMEFEELMDADRPNHFKFP